MKSCTFFGHRDCPAGVLPALRDAVERAIQEGVETFYVGYEGAFDMMSAKVLLEMAGKYPHIRFFVVLAYFPRTPLENGELQKRSILAGGVEHVPRRFAVCRRNEWMLERAQTVIAYVVRPFGGAVTFLEKARKKGKHIVNLGAEMRLKV